MLCAFGPYLLNFGIECRVNSNNLKPTINQGNPIRAFILDCSKINIVHELIFYHLLNAHIFKNLCFLCYLVYFKIVKFTIFKLRLSAYLLLTIMLINIVSRATAKKLPKTKNSDSII